MGLLVLVLGLILFLGPHLVVTMRPQRAALVTRLGAGGYKLAFAALSIAGLFLAGKGFGLYEAAGPLVLWTAPAWLRPVNQALMLLACICVAAAYLRGNIKRMLKHPMLVGVKAWAVAHLLVSGDVGGLILFGSMLAWAVYDRMTLEHRSDLGGPALPEGGWKSDIGAVVAGVVLFLALGVLFHPAVVGRSVFTTSVF